MRMSRRLALYGGSKRAALCYFSGAVSETLTIAKDGTTVATVATNSSGDTETAVELKQGTYTITGSVSGYTKTVEIKEGGTYKAYPDGLVLYWYGRLLNGFTFTHANTGATPVYNTNYLHTQGATSYYCLVRGTTAVSVDPYSKLHMVQSLLWGGTAYSCCGLRNTTAVPSGATGGYVAFANFSGTQQESVIDIASLTGDYYVSQSFYSGGTDTFAIWLDGESSNESDGGEGGTDSGVETLAGTNSVDVLDETYRYLSSNGAWSTAGSISTDNYVGANSSEVNSALIPVGSFSFDGNSTKLRLSFYGYCPSINFQNDGFRWAICTSDANKTLYQTTDDVTTDPSQIAKGTATLAYNNGVYTTYEIDLASTAIPADTPLYVYFWPKDSATDIAHFRSTLTASLYYEV